MNEPKYLVLLTAYASMEYIEKCLAPWIELRDRFPDRFVISAVSCMFREYEGLDLKDDGTIDYLRYLKKYDLIDYLYTSYEPESEAEARSMALKPQGVCYDRVILLDADEIWTEWQIMSVIKAFESGDFIAWASVCYKNFVFDTSTYLEEPFTPPRIFKKEFKANGQTMTLQKFFWDNDPCYTNIKGGSYSYKSFPSVNIPKAVAWVDHYSWLSDERSRKKIEYQKKHFKGICSYDWDHHNNKLIFNKEFYHNKVYPKTLSTDD